MFIWKDMDVPEKRRITAWCLFFGIVFFMIPSYVCACSCIWKGPFLAASKSIFNRIVGEPHAGGFELSFAAFLQSAGDVVAFAKNYLAVGFKLDYVKADGDLSTYTPDFLARTQDGVVWIIETKGREERDLPQKMARLRQWCEDATQASKENGGTVYRFVYVDQEGFEKHTPKTLAALAASFTEYQGGSISANPQGDRETRNARRSMEA